MKIKRVKAEKILNSRRQPTIQITVNGKYSAAAPSGASTGEHEVQAYPKEGIDYVVKFINSYEGFEEMKIERFEDLQVIEDFLPIIKGNPVIALEFAILKAVSDNKVWKFLNPNADSMPMPLGNVIGGGAHVKSGERPDIQEFLLLPRTRSFKEAKFVNEYTHRIVGHKLGIRKMTDEGAWAPKLDTITILDLLQETVEKVGEELGIKVSMGLDVAASEFFTNSQYKYDNYSKENKKRNLNRKEQLAFMELLIKKYDLKYVEDPFQQNDFEIFKQLKNKTSALICGDDLTTTSLERLQKAKDCINAVIIKPNQVGSLIKTREAVMFAKKNDITPIISHRSGETMDATISHLAVAWGIPIIKCGIHGKERQAKLRELLRIEKERL